MVLLGPNSQASPLIMDASVMGCPAGDPISQAGAQLLEHQPPSCLNSDTHPKVGAILKTWPFLPGYLGEKMDRKVSLKTRVLPGRKGIDTKMLNTLCESFPPHSFIRPGGARGASQREREGENEQPGRRERAGRTGTWQEASGGRSQCHYPAKVRLVGSQDLLSLGVAPLRDDVDDGAFVGACNDASDYMDSRTQPIPRPGALPRGMGLEDR